jgi:hypothetical protein
MNTSPLWLAHHYPPDYDRCVRLGRYQVCRRCLFLYPIAIASMIAAAAGLRWPRSLDPPFLITFPIPGTVEFVLEQFRVVHYRPSRQIGLMVPLAVAFGVGLERYVNHPADGLFWGVTLAYCAVWGTAVVTAGGWRGSRS